MILKSIFNAFCDLCFPPRCFHCDDTSLERTQLLCFTCSQQLEMLDPEDHCPHCFSPKERDLSCAHCDHSQTSFASIAAVFDYQGPAGTLIKQLKYGKHQFLASSMGAYLAAQAIRMDWPLPDCLVPVPMSASHYITRGFNQSQSLAQSAGDILSSPVINALGRKSGDYSQAGLSKEQRQSLNNKSTVLIEKSAIKDKIVYLIDDVMTTGQTLRRCAEALQEAMPKKVFALTFCRAQ